MEAEIVRLSSMDHTNELHQLLTEFHAGKIYMESVSRYSAMLDPELAILLELPNLPGGYLVTLPEIKNFQEKRVLGSEVLYKIEKANNLRFHIFRENKFFR